MAVKTTRELVEIFNDSVKDFSISAMGIDNANHTIITSDLSKRYILRRYGDRRYSLLTGAVAPTNDEMYDEFYYDFQMFIANRQHNIDRMYQALFDNNYDPLENYNRTETETITEDSTTEYGHRIGDSKTETTTYGRTDTLSGTDSIAYGKTDTLSGSDTTAITESKDITENKTDAHTGTVTKVRSGSEITTNEKAGFNAPFAYTPDNKSTLDYDDVEDLSAYNETNTIQNRVDDDTTSSETNTYGKVDTLGGSDRTTYGKVDTLGGSDSIQTSDAVTHSGSDSDSKDLDRELHAFGNIGTTTSQQMLQEELTIREKALAEMLLDNFVNEFTFYS